MQPRVRARTAGMTLIELMVVVVVATILFAIAIPSYQAQIIQSRRTEAKTAILDLAGREERFLSTNGSAYTTATANLGFSGAAFPVPTANNYYNLNVCVSVAGGGAPPCDPNANAPNGPAYYITATPIAGTSQANDTACTSFSADSTGQQFSTGSYTSQQCWAH